MERADCSYQLVARFEEGALTLAHFMAREDMESTLIRWMHRIISAQKSFTVTWQSGSGQSPSGHYLRIQDPLPFQRLAKALQVVDQYVKSYGCPGMTFITQPCMPTGTRLAATAGDQDDIYRPFEVKELVLLRRQHQYDACKQVNVFGLQPASMDQ